MAHEMTVLARLEEIREHLEQAAASLPAPPSPGMSEAEAKALAFVIRCQSPSKSVLAMKTRHGWWEVCTYDQVRGDVFVFGDAVEWEIHNGRPVPAFRLAESVDRQLSQTLVEMRALQDART